MRRSRVLRSLLLVFAAIPCAAYLASFLRPTALICTTHSFGLARGLFWKCGPYSGASFGTGVFPCSRLPNGAWSIVTDSRSASRKQVMFLPQLPIYSEHRLEPYILIPAVLALLLWWFTGRPRSGSGCPICGYDLAGLPGRVCPECGAATIGPEH